MIKKIIILWFLLIVCSGCITIGSKDRAMIKTVAEVLVVSEEISQADHDIIVGIIDKYEE